jgi:excisionase family DNA binding protein
MTSTTPAVNWDNLPLMLTAAEAAPIMRLTLNALYVMARQHRIAHVHYGREIRLDRDALRRGDIHSLHTHDAPSSQPSSQSDPLHLPHRRSSPRRFESAPAAGR